MINAKIQESKILWVLLGFRFGRKNLIITRRVIKACPTANLGGDQIYDGFVKIARCICPNCKLYLSQFIIFI